MLWTFSATIQFEKTPDKVGEAISLDVHHNLYTDLYSLDSNISVKSLI